MTKISVTGSKEHLENVIEELHNLQLMDINQYQGELDTGEPTNEAEDLSELLVDVRSLLSKIPDQEVKHEEVKIGEVQEDIKQVKKEIENLNNEEEKLEREIEQTREKKQFFKKLKGTELEIEDLKPSETLDVFIGKLDASKFEANVGVDDYQLFDSKSADVVVYSKRKAERIEPVLDEAVKERFSLPKTEFSGTCQEVYKELDEKLSRLEDRCNEIETKEADIAEEWRGKLVYLETYLTEKIEKAEAPIKFATTQRTFTAEGWIPTENFETLEERLAEVSKGKIHIEKTQQDEEEQIPVKHENNRAVKPFESLTDLVSVPRYNELDPSVVLLLTFPLFFGFMIGDAGYGLTTLAVFYAGAKMFPKGKEIFHSLMYASVATILFGLAFGDAFGYVIFGHHSELAAATGIHLFEQIPILWHRAEHLGQVFTISALIGLVHVNLGYGIGFYNEYIRHGIKEAFLEKGSWYGFQAGIAAWVIYGIMQGASLANIPAVLAAGAPAGLPVVTLSVALIYLGEGVEGMVEIPSLLANILSYLRIFGVSVAAVALAAVVNSIASTAFGAGGIIGAVFGTLILVLGHVFNTFIKIMEGFLQGIRLHYVEMFGKFFEGGGKKYAPFGANQS